MKKNAPQMILEYLKNEDFSVKEKHMFGKMGTCYTLGCNMQNVNYWMFNFHDLFTISVSDMFFEQDFTQTFPSTDYISLYYYDSIEGYELPDRKPIQCGRLSTYIASGDSYTATYRGNVPVRGVSINITPEYYDAYLSEKIPGGFCRLKNAFIEMNYHEENTDLLLVMKQIQNCRMTGSSAQLYYESKVNEAITLVIDHVEKQHRSIFCSECDKRQLAQIEHYITLHYAENISLSILARMACMSISKLKYVFKAVYGCNISEYLNEHRLAQAKKLLQDNRISVTSIANSVGYKTTSAFTKMFKEKTGILPSEYRKSALGPQ
jgi:AraC-like DNA-binding protein